MCEAQQITANRSRITDRYIAMATWQRSKEEDEEEQEKEKEEEEDGGDDAVDGGWHWEMGSCGFPTCSTSL
jgi:hypothetical protein